MIDQAWLSAVNNYHTIQERYGALALAGVNITVALPGVIVALWASNAWIQLAGVTWALLNLLPVLQRVVVGE